MLNSGWTVFNPNAGRVTLGNKVSQLSTSASIQNIERRFVIQKTDLYAPWSNVTPPLAIGLAEEIIDELRKTNPESFFRIHEVK